MMRELNKGLANTVITKDLSRLGRDMRESSYYAEQFFPEHGVRYIVLAVNSVGSYGDFFNGFIRGSLKHKPLQNAFDYGTKSSGTCLAFNGQFCYFVNSIITEFEFNTVKLKEGFILL
jgi:hypothetical protein